MAKRPIRKLHQAIHQGCAFKTQQISMAEEISEGELTRLWGRKRETEKSRELWNF